MTAEILNFKRPVNGVLVEQRVVDGFINATAMCVAHKKHFKDWLKTRPAWDLLVALSARLGIEVKEDFTPDSSMARLQQIFSCLLTVKRGSPENGGGTWIHPKLAVHLAQWCSPEFALLVSDWIEEWMLTGRNPIHSDLDQEFVAWQERYDIRVYLKDFLRTELMRVVVAWAESHGTNPRSLCAQVHDAMNERIQGAKSQQIRLMGGLPLGVLIRDYFGAAPLVDYSAINKLAKNAIQDRGIDPIAAVHEACDCYLGKAYVPKPTRILENVHTQGRRLGDARKKEQIAAGQQLTIWNLGQAM
jgi:KilA-N domain